MAKARTKTKGANTAVPQSRDEAADFLQRIGEASRHAARIEADMNDKLGDIKKAAEADAQPWLAEAKALTEGLKMWCEANRDALTGGGKVKFAELGTGKVSWRTAPAKVTIKGVEAVIDAIRKLGFGKLFLRTKTEVDKEAMLKDPAKAGLVPGVLIGSEGEDFNVEPFEARIEGVAA